MAIRFHSAVLATTLAATAAIGFAAAAVYTDHTEVSIKSDRLPLDLADGRFITVENRSDGVSTLVKTPVRIE